MSAREIFDYVFPLFNVFSFEQIGDSNSYRVTTTGGLNFIFTCTGLERWRFETPAMYVLGLAKEYDE